MVYISLEAGQHQQALLAFFSKLFSEELACGDTVIAEMYECSNTQKV